MLEGLRYDVGMCSIYFHGTEPLWILGYAGKLLFVCPGLHRALWISDFSDDNNTQVIHGPSTAWFLHHILHTHLWHPRT